MEDLFFKALETVTWPGVIALGIYFTYQSGIFNSLASWLKKDTEDARIEDLQQFKTTAETNHFTDLDRLLKDNEKMWKAIEENTKIGQENSKNIAYILGRINGGSKLQ